MADVSFQKWWRRPYIILIIALCVCAAMAGASTHQKPHSCILRGTPAKLPSAVSIQRVRGPKRHHICSGTVVDNQHVYLPAQCIKDINPLKLRVQFGRTNLDEAGGVMRRIIDFKINSNWSSSGPWGYDNALLKMDSPVDFTEDIQPACLADDGSVFPTDTEAMVYGWGLIGEGPLPFPKALQRVNVTVIDHKVCKWMWDEKVDDDMICAGYVKGGEEACIGDTGGSLMMKKGDDWLMAGFIIRSPDHCGVPHIPNVYWTSSKKFIRSAIQEMGDDECGIRDDQHAVGRIHNGQAAATHSWPWMVAIYTSDGRFRGGGALINQYFVVTDSDARPGGYVVLGTQSLSSTTEDTQRIRIEQVFSHPNYTNSNFPQYGMVLAKLSSPVKFNKNVKPVCLPEADDFPPAGTTCMFTGWGMTTWDGPPPCYSDLLHETSATIITNDQCRRDWPAGSDPDGWITSTTFCTAGSEFQPIAWDWGGPLMCDNDLDTWTLYGSLALGWYQHPSLNFNVTAMVPWMNEIVLDQGSPQVCFKRFDGQDKNISQTQMN